MSEVELKTLRAEPTKAGLTGIIQYLRRFNLDLTEQLNHGWNGSNLQEPEIVVSSDGAQWTLTLTGPGTSDLGCVFAGVEYTLDATPAVSVNLTAGTDEVPEVNFIFLTESGGTITLNSNTSGYPTTAHVRIADCILQSAASGATDGPYLNHQHSEHVNAGDGGMIIHHSEKLRELGATWNSGVAAANLVVSSPDAYISVASGTVHQLHEHNFPAIDMQNPTTVYVVNDPTTAFKPITTLDDITQDASSGGINNRHFSLVVWGSMNEGDTGKLFINLPTGTYPTAAASARDVEKYTVFSIPASFKGTGFLIAEYQVEGKNSGAWVQDALKDLRGLLPSASPGGGPGVTEHGDLAGLTDLADHPGYFALDGTRAVTGAACFWGRVTIENTTPELRFIDTNQPLDEGDWEFVLLPDGSFNLRALTEAGGVIYTVFSVARTGTVDFGSNKIITTGIGKFGNVEMSETPPASPLSNRFYKHPNAGGHVAIPLTAADMNSALAGVLTAAQGGIAAGSLEGWHEIGAGSEPAFANSWVNYGGVYNTAAFRKTTERVVYIKGLVKDGTIGNVPIFTLPAGYRPVAETVKSTISNGAVGRIDITANGEVRAKIGNNAYISIDISFPVG